MLIITLISNETTNELTIHIILCRNIIIFCQQELAYLFQKNSKYNFSSSCFIADNSHVKVASLHVVLSTKYDILPF